MAVALENDFVNNYLFYVNKQETYNLHLKTKRSILNSFNLKWTIDDFSILPIGKLKSPVFHPLPNIACHVELEIAADDLRVFLCLQGKDLFLNCEFTITDVNGVILFEKSSTSENFDRFDLTDVTMRGCFSKLKSAVLDKLIFTFLMKIHGTAVTNISSCGFDGSICQVESLKKLSSDFLSAFKNSVNTDVILCTSEGNTIPTHKAVLSARSPVFAKMFEHEMKEKNLKEVYISDVTFDILKKLVEFLYSGELSELEDLESAYDLYYAADKYSVLDLRRICGEVIISKMTADNACQTLARINQHDDEAIKVKVIQYICLHLKDIVNTEEWNTYMDNKLSAEVIKISLL